MEDGITVLRSYSENIRDSKEASLGQYGGIQKSANGFVRMCSMWCASTVEQTELTYLRLNVNWGKKGAILPLNKE